MRILHLITSIDKGGAESQVVNLAEMQKKIRSTRSLCKGRRLLEKE